MPSFRGLMALVLVLGLAGVAAADPVSSGLVTATHTGNFVDYPSQGAGGVFELNIGDPNVVTPTEQLLGGAWTYNDNPFLKGQIKGSKKHLTAFCLELKEDIASGVPVQYDLYLASAPGSLVGLPINNSPNNIPGPQIDAAKDAQIRTLFGLYFGQLDSNPDAPGGESANYARAFQISLWEIVQEQTSTLDITNGTFVYNNPSNPGALALAQTMVQQVAINSAIDVPSVSLFVLDTDGYLEDGEWVYGQGMIGILVPAPPAFLLAGIGLLGLGGFRWARRRLVKN